jgi:NAD(P)-dependent dehydrogenase (short-subunit alcohol dehydrogenase family)
MEDKPVALVTGANQGIGLQIAKDLVAHAGVDRDQGQRHLLVTGFPASGRSNMLSS